MRHSGVVAEDDGSQGIADGTADGAGGLLVVLERGPVDEPLLRRAATRLRNAASHGITACAMLRRFRDDRLSFDEATDILAALKRNPLVAGVDRSGVARELSTLVRIDCTNLHALLECVPWLCGDVAGDVNLIAMALEALVLDARDDDVLTIVSVLETVVAMVSPLKHSAARSTLHALVLRCLERRLPAAALPVAVQALFETAEVEAHALARAMASLHWRLLAQADLSAGSPSRAAMRDALLRALRSNWDHARAFMLAISDSLDELPQEPGALNVLVLVALAECHGLRADAAQCLVRSCGLGRITEAHCIDSFTSYAPDSPGAIAARLALLEALLRCQHEHVRRWCAALCAKLFIDQLAMRGPLATLALLCFDSECGIDACDMLERILDSDVRAVATLLDCKPLLPSELIASLVSGRCAFAGSSVLSAALMQRACRVVSRLAAADVLTSMLRRFACSSDARLQMLALCLAKHALDKVDLTFVREDVLGAVPLMQRAEPLQLFRLDLVAALEPSPLFYEQLSNMAVALRTATLKLSGAVRCTRGFDAGAWCMRAAAQGSAQDEALARRGAWVYEVTRALCIHAASVVELPELPGVWDTGSPQDALLHVALLTGQLAHGEALLQTLLGGSDAVVERLVRLAELREWCDHHESTSASLAALPLVSLDMVVRHLTQGRRAWPLHQLIPMLKLLSDRLAALMRVAFVPASGPNSTAKRERCHKRRALAINETDARAAPPPDTYTVDWDRDASDRQARRDAMQGVFAFRLGSWLKELIVQLAGVGTSADGSRALALALHCGYLLVCVVHQENRAALLPLLEQLAGVDPAAVLPLARVAERLLLWLDHAVRMGENVTLIPYLLELSAAVAWSASENACHLQAQRTFEHVLQNPAPLGDSALRFPLDLPNALLAPFALFRVQERRTAALDFASPSISRTAADLGGELHLYVWTCLTEAFSLPWDAWMRLSCDVVTSMSAACTGHASAHLRTGASLTQIFRCSAINGQRLLLRVRDDGGGQLGRLRDVVQHMSALLALAAEPIMAALHVAADCVSHVAGFLQQTVSIVQDGAVAHAESTDSLALAVHLQMLLEAVRTVFVDVAHSEDDDLSDAWSELSRLRERLITHTARHH